MSPFLSALLGADRAHPVKFMSVAPVKTYAGRRVWRGLPVYLGEGYWLAERTGEVLTARFHGWVWEPEAGGYVRCTWLDAFAPTADPDLAVFEYDGLSWRFMWHDEPGFPIRDSQT